MNWEAFFRVILVFVGSLIVLLALEFLRFLWGLLGETAKGVVVAVFATVAFATIVGLTTP